MLYAATVGVIGQDRAGLGPNELEYPAPRIAVTTTPDQFMYLWVSSTPVGPQEPPMVGITPNPCLEGRSAYAADLCQLIVAEEV